MPSDFAAIVGLAVDVVALVALNKWMKRLNRSADDIEKAPHYKPGSELLQAVKDSEKGCLAYASVEGEVMAVSQVLTSQHVDGNTAVMKEVNIVEHKSKRVQGVWSDVKNTIQDKLECVPFYLRRWMGKGGDAEIQVAEPSEASFIRDDLTTTYDHFEPSTSSLLSRGVDRLFGEVTKGVHTTERMLLTNTILLGVGEIALVDEKLELRPPQSGARYILTTLSKAEVIKRLNRRSFWVKMFAYFTGSIGAAIVIYLMRKYYKIWQENRQRNTFLNEMRAMREQSQAQRAEGNSSEDDNCCVVCLTNPREIVLLNCGHLCLCADCLSVLPEPLACPVCRQDVERYVTTYNP